MIPWFIERDMGKTLQGKKRERNGEEVKDEHSEEKE